MAVIGLFALYTSEKASACNYSYLQLNSVTSVGGGEYDINITFCVGKGQSPGFNGADQNTAAFAFKLEGATYSNTNPYPMSLVSPNTGATYTIEPNYTTSTWAIYDNPSQWWACIGGCGPAGSTCITITLRTVGIPTKIIAGGAEAAGIIVPPYGCNGSTDMEVRPICHGFSVNAGPDKTVYIGYSPASCATLASVRTGGTAPFTYLWSNNATSTSISVCPTVATNYSVSITDANACVVSDAAQVNVVNVVCSGNKVKVCRNGTNRCIKQSQVPSYLNNGYTLGACTAKTNDFDAEEELPSLSVFPNPSLGNTKIALYSDLGGEAKVDLYSLLGSKVESVFEGVLEAEMEIILDKDFTHLPKGIYLIRMQNGNKISNHKLILE